MTPHEMRRQRVREIITKYGGVYVPPLPDNQGKPYEPILAA
jgi:hypothetical protein